MTLRSRRFRDFFRRQSPSSSTSSQPKVTEPVKASSKSSLTKNSADGNAFTDALERFLDELPPEERQSFSSTYRTVTPEDLLRKVEDADKADRESIPRLFFDRTSTFLEVLDGLLAATSSFASLGIPDAASVVIGGARLIIKMALRYVEFFDKLTGMMETLSIHLGHLHQLSEHTNRLLLRDSTARVYGAILRFCHQAYGVFKKADDQDRSRIHLKTFLSTQWKPFEVQFGGLEKDIKDSLNALGHATGAETLNQTIQNGRTLDVLQGETKRQTTVLCEDQRRNYLNFISPLDFDSIHTEILRKRCRGTGDWLLEHESFQDWFNNQDAQLLWCHGPPGVGKSMLSSIVMDHIRNHPTTMPKNVGKAFVSFRYDQMESQDPAKAIAAILKQLASQQKEFPIELVNFFSDHYKNARYPSAEESTKMIATLGRRFAQILIVMDALDECDEGPRERILNLIPEFKAKTFITSRPESSIREAFNRMAVPGFEIDTRSTQLDIERYVNDRLKSLTRPLDHDIETDISGALVDRADGSFLWVHLQMEIICRQKNTKDIRKVLNNLPRGLNDTYTRILKKIENQDEPLRDLGLSCVIWVLKSRRPLSINELMGAVATNETCSSLEEVLENIGNYSEADILDASCNLLTLNYDDWGVKIVRFVHYSVAEFLGKKLSKHINSADFENHELMETKLAKTCMVFLRLLSWSDIPAANRDSSCTLEFQRYSGDHFDKHIIGAGESHYEELRPHIHQLLSDQSTLEMLTTGWWPITCEVNAWDMIHMTHLHKLSAITEDREWNGQDINFWPLRRIASQSADHALELLRPKIIQKDQELDYDLEQWALIWDATSEDRLESLQKFLEAGLDPNKLDPTLGAMDWTALEMACWENKFEAIGMLLSHGAKGKEGNSTFSAALLVATQKGFGKISDLLLQNGAVAAKEMLVAVIAAPFDRYTDRTLLLDKILRQGVDPNEFSDLNLCILESDHRSLFLGEDADPTRQLYCTPLYCAARRGSVRDVRKLLEFGADPNLEGHSCGTAIQAAALEGNIEIVKLLTNERDTTWPQKELDQAFERLAPRRSMAFPHENDICNSLVDFVDHKNVSALHAACRGDDMVIVGEMIERGADIHATAARRTALQNACKSYGSEKHDIIRLLLIRGADVNAISESGTALTAIMFDRYGEDKTVEILLSAGARPDLAAGQWTSALEPAAEYGNVFAVERFLSAVSFNNVQLDSALQAATLWVGPGINANYGPTSRLLLDHGANPRADRGASIISSKGELPLPGASRRGEESVVAALLTAGANVNEPDPYGSPLESAICEIFRCDEIEPFENLKAVIECLRKAGATEPRADCHVGVICNGPLCDQSKQGSWEGYERHPRNREEEYRIHHPAKLWINGTRYVCTKCTTSEINFCSSCAQKIESDRIPCRPDQEDASKMDMLDDDSETAPHQPDHEMMEMLENDITIQMEDLAATLRR
ncbi:hypothetical protein IWZ01DRAFT_477823 [Phyllosticta capitalensis]